MKVMRLECKGAGLRQASVPIPRPGAGEVLIRVGACGVCRTDLHILDGELPATTLPVIPGHEIVGVVEETGPGVESLLPGQRIGVPWLGRTCGGCKFCRRHRENLCENAKFTGYTLPGGYAEYVVAAASYCFPVPGDLSDAETAPLLCAGLIGYRSYRMAGSETERLGLYGFGAAAHIVAQLAVFEGKKVYAFVKPGDSEARSFALRLGAVWAGDSTEAPPDPLDSAIIFAPVGALVPAALRAVDRGGVVVCGGIHMSDIPSFPYQILWNERTVRSVANLTRRDGEELLELAPKVPVRTEIHTYPLGSANRALSDLRDGSLQGAAVLLP